MSLEINALTQDCDHPPPSEESALLSRILRTLLRAISPEKLSRSTKKRTNGDLSHGTKETRRSSVVLQSCLQSGAAASG